MEVVRKRSIGRRQCRFLRALMAMGGSAGIPEVAARSRLTRTEVLQLIGALAERNLIGFGGGRVWIPPGEASHVAGLVRVWCRPGREPRRVRESVLEILGGRGPSTIQELADAAGVSYTAVHKAVTALEGEGKVEKAPGLGRGGRVVVRIRDDTREPAATAAGGQGRR